MVTRRRRWGIRRGESNLSSNQFTMCSPQSGTLREGSWSYIQNRRGRRPGDQKKIEVTRRRKGGIKRRETDLARNQFPKCSPQPGTHTEVHRDG